MFEGEKTAVFWVGLTILGLALAALFSTIWYFLISSRDAFYYRNWIYIVPQIVGSIIFILIGLYMMKSGKV
jgi:multidrug resistance efflux pump